MLRRLHRLSGLLLIGALAAILLWAWLVDPLLLDKTLTQLALPPGLLLLSLSGLTYWLLAGAQRAAGYCCALLTFFYWSLSSQIGGQAVMGLLERDYQPVAVASVEPFDALMVLGGGASILTNGSIQQSLSGDRLGIATRLWHAGKVNKLFVNGSVVFVEPTTTTDQAGFPTEDLWLQLGIDKAAIRTYSGRTTSEEIQSIKVQLPDFAKLRIGLVTSAWHMKRAMRLADASGLQLVPVPADFRSIDSRYPLPASLLPDAGGINNTSAAWKELLAALVGR